MVEIEGSEMIIYIKHDVIISFSIETEYNSRRIGPFTILAKILFQVYVHIYGSLCNLICL